jgi:hypothetical protein
MKPMAKDESTSDTYTRAAWTTVFIAELEKTGIIGIAARKAGVSQRHVRTVRDRDAEFALQMQDAIEFATDVMEEAARVRAFEGIPEPVFGRVARDQDGIVGEVTKYSDALVALLLKGNRPQKYAPNVEIAASGTIKIEYVNDWRKPSQTEES